MQKLFLIAFGFYPFLPCFESRGFFSKGFEGDVVCRSEQPDRDTVTLHFPPGDPQKGIARPQVVFDFQFDRFSAPADEKRRKGLPERRHFIREGNDFDPGQKSTGGGFFVR